jgi:YARHG domain
MYSLTSRTAATILVATGFHISAISQSVAGDDSYYLEQSCQQLWYERNSIYAAAGYCFKTARARRVFGKNCFPPFGKLHIGQRSTVQNIKRAERAKGC